MSGAREEGPLRDRTQGGAARPRRVPAALGPATQGPATQGPAALGPATLGPATPGPATPGPAILGLAALGLAALPPAAGFLWFLLGATAGADPRPAPGIAVLTGGPERVETGLALLAARPGSRLIVSGVGPDSGLADLLGLAAARLAGTDPAELAGRVALGRTATSTRGNAREVAAWAREAGLREVTVVTAGFHMPRALLELGRALPEASLRPHPVPPAVARAMAMLREYTKLVGAALGLSALTERPRGAGLAPTRGLAARHPGGMAS